MVKETISLGVALLAIVGIGIAPSFTEKEFPQNDLPVVGTYEELKRLVKENDQNNNYSYRFGADLIFDGMAKSAGVQNAVAESASPDFSTTNVQVDGVDEADIIKTDGKYFYHIVDNDIIISKVYPAKDMEVCSKISYGEELNPRELFIDEEKIVVIGSKHGDTKMRTSMTKVFVYDTSNIVKPELIRTIESEGDYISARKIENYIYFVNNKNIYYYMFEKYGEKDILPTYKDSVLGQDYKNITCEEIRCFPDSKDSNFMITVGFDLDNLSKKADINTYLGSGSAIYSSLNNIYVAVTKYKKQENDSLLRAKIYVEPNKNTLIYRFELDKGEMNYKAKGEVNGAILNQFSMDENDGYFRVATTSGSVTGSGQSISKNHMYVLDMNLEEVGEILDIAPGEKIHSVRFMGDRAYMVTFRKVDPLFVIDLSNPTMPNILGKLKIPGYSDYLHPYDENHIIGFGKDAVVVNNEDGSFTWTDENNTSAYYQGIKIAMFDVTDVTNPIELWKEKIGDRGTESELLNNHKALLFSKEKNLLAFPITVAEVNEKNPKAWSYGDTEFVGVYVYNISIEKGFELKGRLTNLTENDFNKMGYYYYGDKKIDRLMYIEDVLYTISDGGYTVYDIKSLEKLGELKF